MDTQDALQAITALIDSLGTVGILIWAWTQERKRADELNEAIIEDWKRQNDRDVLKSE